MPKDCCQNQNYVVYYSPMALAAYNPCLENTTNSRIEKVLNSCTQMAGILHKITYFDH